jgi:hypothetical protein
LRVGTAAADRTGPDHVFLTAGTGMPGTSSQTTYLVSSLASFIPISRLSYKTMVNNELWISIFPLYSI